MYEHKVKNVLISQTGWILPRRPTPLVVHALINNIALEKKAVY